MAKTVDCNELVEGASVVCLFAVLMTPLTSLVTSSSDNSCFFWSVLEAAVFLPHLTQNWKSHSTTSDFGGEVFIPWVKISPRFKKLSSRLFFVGFFSTFRGLTFVELCSFVSEQPRFIIQVTHVDIKNPGFFFAKWIKQAVELSNPLLTFIFYSKTH